MATLGDLAKLVRSKNAGPFWLTIDIMFDDAEAYRRARDAEIVNRAAIARLYNRAEILDQMWGARDGFMLIIDTSFAEFDPTSERWGIIWFSDLADDPGSIYKTFDSLAKKASAGEDIFDWVATLSKKVQYGKSGRYFEVKPGIFGVTLNVKALLEDLFHAKPA